MSDLPWFGVIMPIRRDITPWQRPEWLAEPSLSNAAQVAQ